MNAAILSILVLAAPPSYFRTEEKPSTRLFIRTVPAGAKIIVDGKPLGESDGLFVVPPGIRSITIELDGYGRVDRDIPVPEGRITPFKLKLQRADATDNGEARKSVAADDVLPDAPGGKTEKRSPEPGRSSSCSVAAASYLARSEVPGPVREAMQTVLRQHPSETRWSGREGPTLFAIAAKVLPGGEMRQRAVPALLDLVHMLAMHELLKAKSLLDCYAATGLDDATTLRGAVEEAAGELEVTGKVKGMAHQAAVEGDFAVGYVVADESALSAHLLKPAELEKVRAAYRDVMHRKARELMDQSNWSDALLLWRHLHQRKLVSQQLYLDAACCFKELGQQEDAMRILTDALENLGEEATCTFLEKAGDMALSVGTDLAEDVAVRAYEMASEKISETVSTGPEDTAIENGTE